MSIRRLGRIDLSPVTVILSGWGKAATAASRSDRPALATEGSLKTPDLAAGRGRTGSPESPCSRSTAAFPVAAVLQRPRCRRRIEGFGPAGDRVRQRRRWKFTG
jgi:hypothetical protein